MDFDFGLAQDIGTRSEQQDSAAVCPLGPAVGALLVIADGLGGHTGGARASHIVVKTFADAGESGRFKSPKDRYEQLGVALQASNDEIASAARGLPKNETMGTTLVAAAAAWNSIGWISVGDSHLYLWRAGKITKLNEDHSQAGQMLKSGRYKPDDPELDAYRSMLRSAIMGRELTLIDRPIETRPLEKGDIVVLATDGLNVVDLPDIESIVTAHASQASDDLAEALLDAVRASGVASRDNTTVIVARVLGLDGEEKVDLTASSPEQPPTTPKPAAGVQEVTTTAIVTTPFFKTGRPVVSVTRRLEPQSIGAATARRIDRAVAGEAAPSTFAAGDPGAPDAQAKRRSSPLLIIGLAAAALVAAGAWLLYQRAFAP